MQQIQASPRLSGLITMKINKVALIKIVIGILLMAGGVFGAKLACEGAGEIGKLGEYKLSRCGAFTAECFNSKYINCLRKNEAKTGKTYEIKHVFVDGELYNPEKIKQNEEQCNENGK